LRLAEFPINNYGPKVQFYKVPRQSLWPLILIFHKTVDTIYNNDTNNDSDCAERLAQSNAYVIKNLHNPVLRNVLI